MAKYTVTMSCGHESTVELFGKEKDRQKKIEYFQSSGLCKECYKKKMQKKAESQGLIFNASVLPNIDLEDGSILVSVWFSGNTMPYKDDIKALGGYSWSERESASDFYSFTSPPLCWNKIIKFDEVKEEAKKAVSIGANDLIQDSGFFSMVHYQMAVKLQKRWKEQQEQIANIEKPTVPDVLKGHRWNYKIYGKSGNYSVYPDGEKVLITNEQAEELKDYLEQLRAYNRKVEEIKSEKKS